MASHPRYAILFDHCYFHVTWQCHNKDWLLERPGEKSHYIHLIKKYAKKYKVQIYNFCLMSNHPHLTGYCEDARLLSDFFRVTNSVFARAYNKKHSRRGQVVMDRFKSPVIETDRDLINVMLYVEMNPVRAGMVRRPENYHWSSHNFYLTGKFPKWLTPAPAYNRLGKTKLQRIKAYRKLVEKILKEPWKKRRYSEVKFIGREAWVILKGEQLRKQNRRRRLDWLKSYQLKFGHAPPVLVNSSPKSIEFH